MIQLHFGVKQLKIGKTVGVLHAFVVNYVKYANMEGFHRDSHINVCYVSMNIGEVKFGEWLTTCQIHQFFPYQNFPVYITTLPIITISISKYL